MNNRVPAEVFPPGEFIRDELEERGWTQSDLAKIMGRPVPTINLIISGKKAITPDTATELAGAFGTSAEFWLNLENAYKLSKVSVPGDAIRHRAKLFEVAPVKELEKRNWIKKCESAEELENELKSFFSVEGNVTSLEDLSRLKVAARTSVQNGSKLMPEQLVWCVRALQLARSAHADRFTPEAVQAGIPELRQLAAFPESVRMVPRLLAKMGIRFVVVEHLPKTKIDGAALWLGEGWDKPVIAMSMRYDRIDSFWHTLCHEISHVKHRDSYVDVDIAGGEKRISEDELSEIETRANREAADMLIPKDKLQSFILRVRPFYKKSKIIQFANLMKIHPGVIAGQLQHRGEIDWAANREMLVKVRDLLTAEAITDGWGVQAKTKKD